MEPKKQPYLYYYTPAIGWGILILYFSLMPGPQVPQLLKNIEDFFLHSSIYFGLSCLTILGSTQFKFKKPSKKIVWVAMILAIAMGGGVELIQEYRILNRTGDWFDMLANTIGALLGIFIFNLAPKK